MYDKKLILRYILELILMTVLYAILDNVNGLKKYAVLLAVCMLLFVFGRKERWSLETLVCVSLPTVVYVLCGSLSALWSVHFQDATVKVVLYGTVPLLFSFAMYLYYGNDMKRIVHMQFVGACLAYALFDVPYFAKIIQWESVYAFVFGIFVIYFAYTKEWKRFCIAVLFVFFAEKRIALLAVGVTLFVMWIVWLFQKNIKLVLAIWGAIIGGVYGYLYVIYSGIMDRFCWGANINTNGRVEIYERMAEEFEFSPKYFGSGLGVVENLLKYWNISAFSNLHNDLLKFYIELGFWGLLFFLISYGIMFYLTKQWVGKSAMYFLLGIEVYSILLFATDNVSIYLIYLIPFYSTIFSVMSQENVADCLEV